MNELQICWQHPVVPVNDALIDEIESKIRRKLPADARGFLKQFQGGYPDWVCIRFVHAGRKNCFAIGQFVALIPGGEGYLLDDMETYKGRLPPGLLPIAFEAGGSLFCLDYDVVPPRIVYWEHELEGMEDAVTPLASSFTAFLEMLEPYDEEKIRAWIAAPNTNS